MLSFFNKMDKGMKIACLVLAIVIVISAVALVGVVVSRNNDGTTTTTTQNPGGTDDPTPDDGKVTVSWCQGQKVLKEEKIDKGSKVSSWTPKVEGKEFLGWFSNPGLTTAFDFTVAINEDTIIYASFKTTGGSDPIEPETPDYYLAGTGKGSLGTIAAWSPTDMGLGMKDDGDGKYSITVDLYAGDVFQILHGGSWDGQMGVDSFEGVTANEETGVYEVKDADGNVVFYGSGMNGIDITLAEGKDGQYIIRLDSVDGVITYEFVKALDPNDIPDQPVGDATYTVAGNAGLCGSEWDTADTNNDMTLDEATGLFVITYTGVPAGTYQFKICENHAWGVSYGDPNNAADNNNVNITVAEDDAIVIISFNPETKEITVIDGNGNNIGGAVTDTPVTGDEVYTVVGEAGLCGSEWDTADTNNDMTRDEATGIYTKTYTNVAAGEYDYKVAMNHAWGAGEYPTGMVNMTVTVSENGSTVVITWNPTTQELTASVNGETPVTPTPTPTPTDPEIILIGSMNGWNTSASGEWVLTLYNDGITWTGTLTVTEETQVKLYDKSGTYGHDNGWIDPPAGEGENGNAVLSAGTYHFKYVEGDANFTYWADGATEPEGPITPTPTPTPDPSETTYTVAGGVAESDSDAGIFSAYWNPAHTANDMTLSGGVYTITFTGAAIGQYEFKICENHGWDVAYGNSLNPNSGNFKIDVTVADTTVVITFNPETKEITAKDASGNDLSVAFNAPELPEGPGTVVYVQNSSGWSEVLCYYWNDSGNNGWPGTAMSYDTNKGLWYCEIPAGYTSVIFNNGSGTQTADHTVPTDDKVAFDNITNTWYTVDNLPAEVSDFWGIVGSFNGWGNDVKMTEVEPGVWEATVELSAGDTFKVRKNSSWTYNFGTDGAHDGGDISISESGTYIIRLSNIVEGTSATLECNLK